MRPSYLWELGLSRFAARPSARLQLFSSGTSPLLIAVRTVLYLSAIQIYEPFKVEIVLEVALIAIARKVIILDINKYESLTLVGIAALIIAVALAYLVIKRHVKRLNKSGK